MSDSTSTHPGSAAPKHLTELRGFLKRLHYALSPLGAGIILDVLDLATFGPVGILLGAVVGGYAGWVIGECEGFDRNIRIACAICAAAYMTIPLTEPIPAATILVLIARFFAGPPARESQDADSGNSQHAGEEVG